MADTPQLVLIEWIDSRQPMPGWQRLSDLESRRANKCISVGFLVREDAQSKVIAPNLGSTEGDDDWDQASGLMTIPATSITGIKFISTFQVTGARPRPLADAQWLRRLA